MPETLWMVQRVNVLFPKNIRVPVSSGRSLTCRCSVFGIINLMLIKNGVSIISGIKLLNSCARSCMLSPSCYSSVVRRQQFLIRSLCGCNQRIHHRRSIQAMTSAAGVSLETDAESVLKAITPSLDPKRHKGQAGKIAVIGGCREYTGAPYFAAISALRIGADLSHVFCTKDAAPVIKSYSPELIVHPILEESYSISGLNEEKRGQILQKVLSEVDKWMERFDCLVIGPGLGRDPFLLECVGKIMKLARDSNVPLVIDGDGLFLVTNNIHLVSGYPLAVLTPNVNEYKRLVQKVLSCEANEQNPHEQLLCLAKQIGGVTILQKGKSDLISDGEIVKSVSVYGSPRRCGGQGDILSGSVAVFLAWANRLLSAPDRTADTSPIRNPSVLGCIAASALLRKAASLAFQDKKRSTLTTDIIECLGKSLEDICPAT